MFVRRLLANMPRTGCRHDGGICAGPFVRSASAAVAGGAAWRYHGQAGARLSQLDPQPPQISIGATCSTRWSRTCRRSPDHIAITGDFVNLALEAEFAPARAWLEGVGSSDRVTIVPGNHDAYVRATRHRFARRSDIIAMATTPDGGDTVSVPAPARPAGADRRILGGPDPAADGDRMAWAKPACGAGPAARRAFRRTAFPCAADPSPAALRCAPKRLTDSDELCALLKRHGVELILHGHDHVHSTMWIDGPIAPFPRSAYRRHRRWRMAVIRPRPTTCFRSPRRQRVAMRASGSRYRRQIAGPATQHHSTNLGVSNFEASWYPAEPVR